MIWGTQRFFVCAVATASLLSTAPHAFAGPQLKTCTSDENSADVRIETCTAVIDYQTPKQEKKKRKGDADTEVSSKDKAVAYFSRGKAYRAKNNSDQALRDFDEAIKLNTGNADRRAHV